MTGDILEELNVSRETLERLEMYAELVRKWTKSINLISKGDAAEIWSRHILDSAQIYELAPKTGPWLDLGSGGGFPGLVAAILDQQHCPDRETTLVDSDQRKCAFLRTVVRELGLKARVEARRVEEMKPHGAAVLSARALGGLPFLLDAADRHLQVGGVALFPKGKTWQKEHEDARKAWSYRLEALKSKTNPEAIILKIEDIARV